MCLRMAAAVAANSWSLFRPRRCIYSGPIDASTECSHAEINN